MFLKVLFNYLVGFVNISIEGYFIERFINICISKKILLWNMKREKSTIMHTNIGISDIKKIRKIAKTTKCKISIQKKIGIPFLLYKYKKRKIFFALLISVIFVLILTSKFIWNIEIVGNTNIPTEEIINSLMNENLKVGSLKYKINTNNVISNIRLKRNDIAWMGINLEGTNAIIQIKEVEKKPEIIKENEYCNIISEKDGVITKINAQNGTAVVKVGDIVKKDSILVAGYMEGKFTGIRYVHSVADIEAKVWYSKKEKFYINQTVKIKTGKQENKYSIKFNKFEINLYKTLSKFKNYDTIKENKKVMLFSNFYLPIELQKMMNYEYKNEEKIYETQELITLATEKLNNELLSQISNSENIVNKQVNVYENEGYIEVEIIYEVIENIGVKEKIVY